jgi:hypothetical protein
MRKEEIRCTYMGLQRALVSKIKSTGGAAKFFFAPNGGYSQVGTFPKGNYDKKFHFIFRSLINRTS